MNQVELCCKCKENKAQVENRKEKVCNECFLQQCLHRFKSTIRTKLKIWNDQKFLVCVSGGANSMAMLDMLYHSMDSNTHRKMFYKVQVLYIDEGIIYNKSKEERLQTQARLTEFISAKSSFDLCILPLQCLISHSEALSLVELQTSSSKLPPGSPQTQANSDINENSELLQNQSDHKSLQILLNKLLTVDELTAKFADFLESFPIRGSSRQDIIVILKRRLMCWVARKLAIRKVLLGSSGFSVASGIFGALCKGRGAHLPFEVGFSDELRGEDVLTCLPLKDLLLKEITYYNHLCKVPVEQQITLAQQLNTHKLLPSHGSLNELCENFLSELQTHSFMTMPTVLRTGARLALKDKPKELCTLCRGVIDEAKNPLETLSVSLSAEESKEEAKEKEEKPNLKKPLDPLCFGCEKLMKESKWEEVRSYLNEIWEKF